MPRNFASTVAIDPDGDVEDPRRSAQRGAVFVGQRDHAKVRQNGRIVSVAAALRCPVTRRARLSTGSIAKSTRDSTIQK